MYGAGFIVKLLLWLIKRYQKIMTKILSFYLLVVHTLVFSQHSYSIQGHFPHFPNSKYELKGFSGFQQITLSTSESKDDGKFVINYPSEYCGVAHLYMNGAYQNLFLLNKENINVNIGKN